MPFAGRAPWFRGRPKARLVTGHARAIGFARKQPEGVVKSKAEKIRCLQLAEKVDHPVSKLSPLKPVGPHCHTFGLPADRARSRSSYRSKKTATKKPAQRAPSPTHDALFDPQEILQIDLATTRVWGFLNKISLTPKQSLLVVRRSRQRDVMLGQPEAQRLVWIYEYYIEILRNDPDQISDWPFWLLVASQLSKQLEDIGGFDIFQDDQGFGTACIEDDRLSDFIEMLRRLITVNRLFAIKIYKGKNTTLTKSVTKRFQFQDVTLMFDILDEDLIDHAAEDAS